MNDPTRLLATHERRPYVAIWAMATAIATALCVLIAPFGTDAISWPGRIAFWTSWNVFSAALMYGILSLVLRLNVRGYWRKSLICAAVFASIYTPLWALINERYVGLAPPNQLQIWLDCFLIAMAIFAIVSIAIRKPSITQTATPKRAPLYERLEKYPHARILALQAQDHYVEVITDQGRELLRMRFQDALRELAPIEGAQVHRSYWVARDAITAFDRKGLGVELVTGEIIPVSKRRAGELRRFLASAIAQPAG